MSRQRKFSPKFVNFWHEVSLLTISIFISLVAVEGIIRLYLYSTREILPVDCRQEDRLLNHSLVPNSNCRFKTKEWDIKFQVNHLGMRDRDYSEKKPLGTYRILLLGDSFAEGYGVEESQAYQNLLEEKLNQVFRQNIEVLNAGVQSYSPSLEYLYLLHRGLKMKPDLVIVNLDLTDFSDEQRYQAFLKTGIRLNQIALVPEIKQEI